MTHLDPDEIALLALGEESTDGADAHLAECPDCARQLVELGHVAELGRDTRALELESPSAAVWTRIRDELGLEEPVAAPVALPVADAESAPGGSGASGSSAAHSSASGPTASDSTARHRPERRRTSRLVLTAVAACAALVVGVAGGAWWQASRTGADAVVLASAELEAFPAWQGATGTAELEDVDGGRELVVHLDTDGSGDGYREVWLLAADASALVPLGALDGTEGRFAVPADLDLAQYPLVDVSEEPLDGDPAHSGDSIVRGPLLEG
ncbi:anti-sigma factor [Rathayibacter sp. SD072]|uniref:anti-sigma factor n=1 Tax=Rathayibacter sp. SD072 TaxID=2781731 RepID=UPI001A958C37|nr:anti-sigma factor [Rathayibacter sp. SD072]MBO0985605.1 anti-sigma factor [Rathayibacter sp. SD072]